MLNPRNAILVIVIIAIIGSIFFLDKLKPKKTDSTNTFNPVTQIQQGLKNATYPKYAEIVDPTGFINTDPFKLSDLVGKKIILVDFWTYSCINCQRTTPYLNSWYSKYSDQGFVIIGVHTPEFEFEKNINNVKSAVEKFGIQYPVVLDSNYGTWSAYNNRYWPAKYLIDINGNVVYYHFGEGEYETTEQMIQALLKERMEKLGENGLIDADTSRPDGVMVVDNSKVKSPETYFGALRNNNFGNGQPGITGNFDYVPIVQPALNKFYLSGNWDINDEFAKNTSPGAKIIFMYSAKSVYLVAGSERNVRLKILRDGKVVTNERGEDVDSKGVVLVKDEGLYKLIDDPQGYGVHTLEIEILDPGLKAFTFTFG
jgi:thiol-disulfide isomerase/thioredoxin